MELSFPMKGLAVDRLAEARAKQSDQYPPHIHRRWKQKPHARSTSTPSALLLYQLLSGFLDSWIFARFRFVLPSSGVPLRRAFANVTLILKYCMHETGPTHAWSHITLL